jgi:hypothetical protein
MGRGKEDEPVSRGAREVDGHGLARLDMPGLASVVQYVLYRYCMSVQLGAGGSARFWVLGRSASLGRKVGW